MNGRLMRRLDSLLEQEDFRSRSEAIQEAVAKKLARPDRSRLARECAKLLPAEEQEQDARSMIPTSEKFVDVRGRVGFYFSSIPAKPLAKSHAQMWRVSFLCGSHRSASGRGAG